MTTFFVGRRGRLAVCLPLCAAMCVLGGAFAHADDSSSVIVVAPSPAPSPSRFQAPSAPIASAPSASQVLTVPAPSPAPSPSTTSSVTPVITPPASSSATTVSPAPVLPVQPSPLEGSDGASLDDAEPRTDAQRLYQRGVRQRNVGIALVIIGAGLAAASAYAFYDAGNYGDVKKSTSVNQAVGSVVDRTLDYSLGGVAALLGSGALVSGAILIPVGQGNINRAEKLGGSGLGFAPAPKGSLGAGLSWTF